MRLLSRWSRRGAKGGVLALSWGETSFRYVLASEANERGATLASWGTEARGHQPRESFMRRIKASLPAAERVIVVLDASEYQILQLEAPNVPPQELRSAVRWRATEFLDGSPHDYTLDVLNVASEGAAKVIAVVAHNDVVRTRMLECEELDRPAAVIDVGETAQRNLLYAALAREPGAPAVAAALQADASRALMVIAVGGQLYFFRRFEFNTDLLSAPADEAQSSLIGKSAEAETAARSLTQLQRSLDLWDDSYPHLPLACLRICAGAKTEAIAARLSVETGVDTRPLALESIFKVAARKGEPPWAETAYLPLLGALLRPAVVS